MNLGRLKYGIIFLLAASAITIGINFSSCCLWPDRSAIIERQVDELLSKMTLDEKIGQMTQVRHFKDIEDEDIKTKLIGSVIHTQGPIPGNTAKEWQKKFISLQKKALSTRLGIPLLIGVDAVHGQNTFNGATMFPHNIGLGATRNEALVEEIAEITALEMEATGFNWTFSPCLAIPYNEKWGRVYEAFSEDPMLTAKLGAASIKGLQGSSKNHINVLATAKHYMGDGATDYGIEGGHTSLKSDEINNILLPPYRLAVNQGVGSVMVSFNSLAGETMHAHNILITDTLKNSLSFDGIVLTDWKGYTRFGGNRIINAGIDMVMAVDGDLDIFNRDLRTGLRNGEVSHSRIDDAVRRILRQKFRMGLFENPFPDTLLVDTIGCKTHRDVARQAVRESLVLLKNKNHTLPISKKTSKVVVVGEHANNSGLQSGGWTTAWQGVNENYKGATTILDGIIDLAEGEVVYDERGIGTHTDADIAIVVVGEMPYAEFFGDIGDGKGLHKLTLNNKHQEYINNYYNKGPKIVVVLVSGRPLVTTKQINQSDAFIAAWLPGSEGDGIAEVLFGDYNFTGKLPHSWPKSIDDYSGKYGPNYWDINYSPLFEYGFGLQYPDDYTKTDY